MSDQKTSNLELAAAQLEETKAIVLPLLQDNPAFQLRTQTALDRLIAGFRVANGSLNSDSSQASNNLKPLTSFFGNKIGQAPVKTVVEADKEEVNLIKSKAEKVYPTFSTRENAEIMEATEEIVIRAVAKMSGLGWVTSARPAKIDSKFIDQIKEAMVKKEQNENAKELERRADLLVTDYLFTRVKDEKTLVLGDKVVTEEQVMNDEYFNELIDELNK